MTISGAAVAAFARCLAPLRRRKPQRTRCFKSGFKTITSVMVLIVV